MIELEKYRDRAILVGVCTGSEEAMQRSLHELSELAETAGAEVITQMYQVRNAPDPGLYLGKGKLQELKELIVRTGANGIICDDELSPAQLKNMSDILGCTIIDRTLLILDIFAARARTSEGKIQVELAQLKYRSMRLIGLGKSMSRLGGGIGTRGPGEKKLEMDRRLIQDRIVALNKELKEIRKHRDLIWEGRKKSHLMTAAIVGYTNAGKSTLLNTLTEAGVLTEDALFATLDPTTRALELPGGHRILLTDTVGFIDKLPHHLIEAFRSTLEEAAMADIIVHVADASNPDAVLQMQVVYETLHELQADDKSIITLMNKKDLMEETSAFRDLRSDQTIFISAKYGDGLDRFEEALEEMILKNQILLERVFSYAEAAKVSLLHERGQILEESYEQDGIHIKAYVPKDVYGKL
jgi:GTP-binding protein HflX